MNPVTQHLVAQLSDEALAEFVAQWDALEALIVEIFRSKAAGAQETAEYLQLRRWLRAHYPRWQAALQPLWPQTKTGDEPTLEDPFLRLLTVEQAADFVANWQAMQTLPAAREALNQLLLELINEA